MKRLLLLCLIGMTVTMMTAQRHTDRLDRGLVSIPIGSTTGSTRNLVMWRRLTNEQYDVTYNLYKYKDGQTTPIAKNLTKTCYDDNGEGYPGTQYQVAAVVKNVEQEKCPAMTGWAGNAYRPWNNGPRYAFGYLDINLAPVTDRDGQDVTSHYSPNDAEMADLDGDGQLEIIIKRLNDWDASDTGSPTGEYQKDEHGNYILDENNNKIPIYDGGIYSANSKEFVVIDAYDVNWQTGEATLLWRIDCGPNMVSLNSTEIDVIAYDWDEDGKAEVVLRGADDMIIHQKDSTTETVGIAGFNFRSSSYFNHSDGWQYAWSHFGREYLIYMNGETGKPYQITDFPLPRLEKSEWPSGITYNDYAALLNNSSKAAEYFKKNSGTLHKAWGDNYGHRSTKYFFGAPFLDGRHASLFLGRGIYTRHKMIAMRLEGHEWKEQWRWDNNNSSSAWYGNGYHNFIVADVDEDGRDEIVYGSMVIDDNGKGLSTTGLGHGDAQHVGDFDPYRRGLEFFGCNEDNPGMNYRNATTSELYVRSTAAKDDGRGLMDNFTNAYPGSQGRSVSSGLYSSVTDKVIENLTGDTFIPWGDLNFRIYWDGDLCSEILNSPGTAKEAKIEKPGEHRQFTSSGCNMNNDSKNNPCFQGDIIGDWREEIVVRRGTDLRVYTTGIGTEYSLPTLWNDHQYRQAMVWQMMAYNQPPHLSYFLGELEGITVAPPTVTDEGREEITDGKTVGHSEDGKHLLVCETKDMTVSVEDGASPYILTVNTPTWVQGNNDNGTITTTTYTHTLTGGAFGGSMRLVKQGNGVLVLPDVTETYTGETNVWAGTLRFNGTMASSPVWLNRFATLDTDGGTFGGSVTADYGATIAVGNGGMTTTTLTLNHGTRLKVSIGSDGKATPVNISNLILKKKSGEVWEQYGPKYLKPVIEFTHSGLLDGVYFLGNVGSVTGDISNDVILEGLNGVHSPRLQAEGGKLFLIVGTGESVTCPEATFAVSSYQRTANGLLPVVRIEPGTFSYGGSEVTPTLSAMYNGTAMDLQTLYSEDYEQATDASAWVKGYATIELVTNDAQHGSFIRVSQGGGSGPRSSSTKFYSKNMYNDCTSYAVEFDAYSHYTNGNFDPNEIILYGEGAKMPYTNAIFSSSNYIFKITGGKNYSTDYTVEGSSSTYRFTDGAWYHYQINIDRTKREVKYAILDGTGNIVGNGIYIINNDDVNMNAQGIEVGLGRAWGHIGIDNIRIYRTDGHYFAFTEPGTLTVTTGYPGCLSGTATYNVTEYVKMGDANMDGRVDISDVTAAISHIASQTPAVFCKEAADMDGNGTVEAADLRAIANQIVGSNQ